MGIDVQPVSTTNSDGSAAIPTISPTGQVSVTDDCLRRIQEIILLMQQANLISTQLVNDKTSKYNFMEIR